MGTEGRGSVLELWLLGPDVVVEPGEKLAETRAAETERDAQHDKRAKICSCSGGLTVLTFAVVQAVDGVVVGRCP